VPIELLLSFEGLVLNLKGLDLSSKGLLRGSFKNVHGLRKTLDRSSLKLDLLHMTLVLT
jgi:hypothetical protein